MKEEAHPPADRSSMIMIVLRVGPNPISDSGDDGRRAKELG